MRARLHRRDGALSAGRRAHGCGVRRRPGDRRRRARKRRCHLQGQGGRPQRHLLRPPRWRAGGERERLAARSVCRHRREGPDLRLGRRRRSVRCRHSRRGTAGSPRRGTRAGRRRHPGQHAQQAPCARRVGPAAWRTEGRRRGLPASCRVRASACARSRPSPRACSSSASPSRAARPTPTRSATPPSPIAPSIHSTSSG